MRRRRGAGGPTRQKRKRSGRGARPRSALGDERQQMTPMMRSGGSAAPKRRSGRGLRMRRRWRETAFVARPRPRHEGCGWTAKRRRRWRWQWPARPRGLGLGLSVSAIAATRKLLKTWRLLSLLPDAALQHQRRRRPRRSSPLGRTLRMHCGRRRLAEEAPAPVITICECVPPLT